MMNANGDTTSNSSSDLTKLLSLASSLHAQSDLSLQQLVPVHQSLIQATLCDALDNDAGAPTISSLENAISSLPEKHDHALAQDLIDSGSEAQQLLVLQYLMAAVNDDGDSLQALATLVLPFLQRSTTTQLKTNELQQALLNTVLTKSTNDNDTLSLTSLQACLHALNVENARPNQWTLVCRVLVTLHAVLQSTTASSSSTELLQDELTNVCYSTVMTGIQQALVSPNYLTILNPIVTWLLPLLFDKQEDTNSQRTDELWKCLMEQVVDIQSQQVALIVSAVLCSILPSLATAELPVVESNSNDTTTQQQQEQRSLAIYQPALWKLILYSLQQGMTFANLKKGGFQTSISLDQMLRRRGLYLLGLLLDHYNKNISIWQKYLLCFQALEMETEPHLIEQVWNTVAQVCVSVSAVQQQQDQSLDARIPNMSWEWVSALLARVLLSETPILRKIGLYRFLSGHAGILMSSGNIDEETNGSVENSLAPDNKNESTGTKNKKQKKKQSKNKGKTTKALLAPAPITIVSIDFVLNVILPSFDTLGQSVGTNFQYEEHGKVQYQDVTPLLETFLATYVSALDLDRRRSFLLGLFSPSIVCDLRLKTVVLIYQAVANANIQLPMEEDLLKTAVSSFGSITSSVALFKEQLMAAFATMLSHSCSSKAIHPEVLLKTLALYPIPTESPASLDSSNDDQDSSCDNIIASDPKYAALQTWLANVGDSPSWACTVGEACASAFCMGQLFPPTSEWTPESGSSETERIMGGSIVLLCTLAAASTESNASKLLWPAIHKGLASVPQSPSWHGADRTCRSLVLLENGCRLGVTSGVGNGDLVMDKSQRMMPPPPNVEAILSHAVDFDLAHIEALTSFNGAQAASRTGSSRSGVTTRVLSTFSRVITQIQVYCSAYPSSLAVSSAADGLLQVSMEKLADTDLNGIAIVQNTALVFGALSCGASQTDATSTFESVSFILNLNFPSDIDRSMCNIQTARSVFQYAKWGALSFLLPKLLEGGSGKEMNGDSQTLLTNLFDVAEDSVYSTPADALMPLFDCCVVGARSFLSNDNGGSCDADGLYTKNLTKIVDSLFALKAEVPSGRPSIYMLNQICCLLFRPDLLMDEYRMRAEGEDVPVPIRDAFRRLMEMAGTERPHISRITLSYISVAWRGNLDDASTVGLGAILYRTDICDLLLRKEVKLEKSSTVNEADIVTGPIDLPPRSDESSITRGFILMFLSSLPDVNDGLPPATLVELLHFIIFHLLNDVCLVPNTRGAIMIGGPEYSGKIRAWQALYVLSRFVTEDIADSICESLFECIGQNLHGGIRYFVEAFAIQFARKHPAIFGRKLVKEIRRTDLSLQNVSSLLIVAGNIIVGRYKDDFLAKINTDDETVVDLKEILAGAIPWLSSTQGFTRAISQLLVHKLVPLVIDVDDSKEISLNDNDWYLKTNYQFLDSNPEMKRLRKKQSRFFDQYDVDEMCSAKALLQLEVDEGSEANPDHAVDAIKKCLEQVYLESHENETPIWKQVADMMEESNESSSNGADPTTQDDELVSFQRKIIPLDSLELDLEASRDARLKNARGRKKQKLVVCASLVDKVPNLGGLARTSEIFAAERLVIPDTTVCKMDNFKSISVGAGDWIDIEGCREDQLLNWLRKQKEQGYMIVGVEQTSSSLPLSSHTFIDKTVLLLGKEKEGIPVEFLQVVDVCVEIPQFGVIRSLNVHVTGALCIWEYTCQMMERQSSSSCD